MMWLLINACKCDSKMQQKFVITYSKISWWWWIHSRRHLFDCKSRSSCGWTSCRFSLFWLFTWIPLLQGSAGCTQKVMKILYFCYNFMFFWRFLFFDGTWYFCSLISYVSYVEGESLLGCDTMSLSVRFMMFCLTFEDGCTMIFEMSETIHSPTQCHTTEDLNPQP